MKKFYQKIFTGEPIELNIENECYTLLKKISKNNNIPIGEIELYFYPNAKYIYLRHHPRYTLNIEEILKDLHAIKIDVKENLEGNQEYKLQIQDIKFGEKLYQEQKELEHIEFDKKDYEWLWEETYEEHIKKEE